MHWVAWDTVTRHIKEGGLGLNKLQTVNTSLLVKWGWRFKTEGHLLWKKIIGALHSNRKGWECIPFKKSLPGVVSETVRCGVLAGLLAFGRAAQNCVP
uniref:Reverse transcriptase zinc-binding domain-containing protein n=1 Tax=Helianthus annuus TaxID=4232 RepID=A0A251SPH5_HELAN